MEQKPLDYYRALYRIATEVASGITVEQRAFSIVKSTAIAMGVKGCSLMLLTPDGNELIHTASYGLSSFYVRKGPLKIDPILDEVLKGNPIVVDDVTSDPRVQYREQAVMEGISSMVSLPITFGGEVTGILRVYASEPGRFSSADVEFLQLVANFDAIILTKAQAYDTREQYYKQRIKDMAAQWTDLKSDLVELETAKSKLLTFLSMAAHDLKAPLAALQAYFDVLLGGFVGDLNEKQLEIIQRSSSRVDGLFNLISDLLDICKIESPYFLNEMEEFSLTEVSAAPIEDAQRLAQEKGVNLVLNIPDDLPCLQGSPARLCQVVTNLLSNAVKFTPEGGTAIFSFSLEDGCIKGEVSDTGIGIPEADLGAIFEDFFRSRNAKEPGTGLGLPIVKRIIESHRGQISVMSPDPGTGKGSRFTFTLPLCQL